MRTIRVRAVAGMRPIEEKDHITGVGNIILNLQALESPLRALPGRKIRSVLGLFQKWATRSPAFSAIR